MGRCRRGMGFGAGGRPRRIRRFVEPAVLLLLHREPAHGYALLHGLREMGMEQYPMDTSTIYRILYDLEAAGMVSSQEVSEGSAGPPRRIYALTRQGDDYLNVWVDDLRLTDQMLHRFFEAYDATGHETSGSDAQEDQPDQPAETSTTGREEKTT